MGSLTASNVLISMVNGQCHLRGEDVTGRPPGPRRLLLKHIYNIFTREDKISE